MRIIASKVYSMITIYKLFLAMMMTCIYNMYKYC